MSAITKSGLSFVDINYQTPFWMRSGIPISTFGMQYMENTRMLPFIYLASDSVSSFTAVKITSSFQTIAEYDLSTSLISSDGTYHICDGQTDFIASLECGFYYFIVNNKYYSDIVKTLELDNEPWILVEGFWNGSGIWLQTEPWNAEPEVL